MCALPLFLNRENPQGLPHFPADSTPGPCFGEKHSGAERSERSEDLKKNAAIAYRFRKEEERREDNSN